LSWRLDFKHFRKTFCRCQPRRCLNGGFELWILADESPH
jgi:hypothetical protein